MALYTIRSERQFCEQLDYNMLFRWFLDMDMVEPSFHHSTFSKNRQRLMAHDVAKLFFALVVEQARAADLMSRDHFTVDGTPDRSVGFVQESAAQGRPVGEAAARRPRQPDGGLPR